MLRKVIGVVFAGALLFVGAWTPLSAVPRDQTAQKSPAATPVNLNTASPADLEKLPGAAPRRRADHRAREKNGPFKKIEGLARQGIGEKAFRSPLVAVAAPILRMIDQAASGVRRSWNWCSRWAVRHADGYRHAARRARDRAGRGRHAAGFILTVSPSPVSTPSPNPARTPSCSTTGRWDGSFGFAWTGMQRRAPGRDHEGIDNCPEGPHRGGALVPYAYRGDEQSARAGRRSASADPVRFDRAISRPGGRQGSSGSVFPQSRDPTAQCASPASPDGRILLYDTASATWRDA